MAIEIRDVKIEDLDTILALNEAAVPHVNSIPFGQMKVFHDHAATRK